MVVGMLIADNQRRNKRFAAGFMLLRLQHLNNRIKRVNGREIDWVIMQSVIY